MHRRTPASPPSSRPCDRDCRRSEVWVWKKSCRLADVADCVLHIVMRRRWAFIHAFDFGADISRQVQRRNNYAPWIVTFALQCRPSIDDELWSQPTRAVISTNGLSKNAYEGTLDESWNRLQREMYIAELNCTRNLIYAAFSHRSRSLIWTKLSAVVSCISQTEDTRDELTYDAL